MSVWREMKMKVAWRNAGEKSGTFDHWHFFSNGEKRDGKSPREFIIHLINASTASEIALNDKPIWKLGGSYTSPEELVIRAMMGEPREASILITVDYNVQGDWIDGECGTCGYIGGNHRQKCRDRLGVWKTLDSGWLDMVVESGGN
jgi:hypothetical protein